jgi:ACT domain-containing protein
VVQLRHQEELEGLIMTTKLFERLVTKFSIKVADLIKYLEISKATIYNYRNLENFSDIPKDKQYKIYYLFGKETVEELELVLDESDPDILAKYVIRISKPEETSVTAVTTQAV